MDPFSEQPYLFMQYYVILFVYSSLIYDAHYNEPWQFTSLGERLHEQKT